MNNPFLIQVLIAEDDETDAFFIKRAFENSDIKSSVHIVRDGRDVMRFLERRDGFENVPAPHLIFLDINMPNINGHDALKAIKQSEKFRHIPVVMLSSSRNEKDVRKSYENFASAHVTKCNGFEDMQNFVKSIQGFWFMRAILPQDD